MDQHYPSLFAAGAAHTVYIWGTGNPATEDVGLFNFDLNSSGSALTFSNAAIGPSFTGSFVDDNLNDLQIGWSVFGGTVAVRTSPPTLFATLDVAVALRCAQTAAACTVATQATDCPGPGDSCVLPPPGASTVLELQGPEYTVTGDIFQSVEIPTTGADRDLLDHSMTTIPTVGTVGLVIMAVVVLGAGVIVIGRRRAAQAA
ncbi:MAG: hypothetical protein JSU86_17990 [Phycisphaerales bacterium]|nr:MAG: hypothetical protein JSU86_17990 [Phycisphaerales bacterium]